MAEAAKKAYLDKIKEIKEIEEQERLLASRTAQTLKELKEKYDIENEALQKEFNKEKTISAQNNKKIYDDYNSELKKLDAEFKNLNQEQEQEQEEVCSKKTTECLEESAKTAIPITKLKKEPIKEDFSLISSLQRIKSSRNEAEVKNIAESLSENFTKNKITIDIFYNAIKTNIYQDDFIFYDNDALRSNFTILSINEFNNIRVAALSLFKINIDDFFVDLVKSKLKTVNLSNYNSTDNYIDSVVTQLNHFMNLKGVVSKNNLGVLIVSEFCALLQNFIVKSKDIFLKKFVLDISDELLPEVTDKFLVLIKNNREASQEDFSNIKEYTKFSSVKIGVHNQIKILGLKVEDLLN